MRSTLWIGVAMMTAGLAYAAEAEKDRFKAGEKVQVKVRGCFIDGTYASFLNYSNMKATPHSVSFSYQFGSGRQPFAPADVRKPTKDAKVCPTTTPDPVPSAALAKSMTVGIARTINRMRRNPTAWSKRHLRPLKGKYKKVFDMWFLDMGRGHGAIYIGTNDGDRASHEKWLDETIAALEGTGDIKGPKGGGRLKRMKKLAVNKKLATAAGYFANDAGRVNGPRHTDSRGRSAAKRATDAGYTGGVNECIGGSSSAMRTVVGLLIDWKVDSRGHRANLLAPNSRDIGVAVKYWPKKGSTEAFLRVVVQCGYGEQRPAKPTRLAPIAPGPKTLKVVPGRK